MTTVEYFQVSECFREKDYLKSLIDIIQKSVGNFASPLKKSIKIIGSEHNFKPQLILLDLVVENPYLQEYNVFKIRINEVNYEVVSHEERLTLDNIKRLDEIIPIIMSNYDFRSLGSFS